MRNFAIVLRANTTLKKSQENAILFVEALFSPHSELSHRGLHWDRLFVPSRVISAELKSIIVPRARHVSLTKRCSAIEPSIARTLYHIYARA